MGVSFYCLCSKNKQKEQIDNNSLISIKVSNNDFTTKYDNSARNYLIKNFLIKLPNQDRDPIMFFHEENSQNSPFSRLKKKEREDLIQFFKSQRSGFVDNISQKINEVFNKNFTFDDYVLKMCECENVKNVYSNKIKRLVQKFNQDKKIFEIKYLTIMLVGKSGVGKSTLINNLLKLNPEKKAITGTGNFQTTKIQEYKSERFPILRLVDTRGIELNKNYGAENVKKDAVNFIEEQIKANDPKNFVQCIWYCITGNRFEQVEIDLLNSLRKSYGDNTIPIIIVYTQSTDTNAITDMEKYIKEKKIDANFKKVLAERKLLVNDQYLEPFGMDKLVQETLEKCKKAMKGEMRSVMTKNISNRINEILIGENAKIKKYIYEQSILDFTSNYKIVKNDEDFMDYLIKLISFNIIYFCEKKICSKESIDYFKKDYINKMINLENYMKYYKDLAKKIMEPKLKSFSIDFIDYQVEVQKMLNKEIKIQNKRRLQDFIENSRQFLCDNFYYIAQVYFIPTYINKVCIFLSDSFEKNINKLLKEILSENDIDELISKCFLNKFSEFEKRVKNFFEDNKNIVLTNNYENNNLQNNQQIEFMNEYPADLPSIRDINNANNNNNNYNE